MIWSLNSNKTSHVEYCVKTYIWDGKFKATTDRLLEMELPISFILQGFTPWKSFSATSEMDLSVVINRPWRSTGERLWWWTLIVTFLEEIRAWNYAANCILLKNEYHGILSLGESSSFTLDRLLYNITNNIYKI